MLEQHFEFPSFWNEESLVFFCKIECLLSIENVPHWARNYFLWASFPFKNATGSVYLVLVSTHYTYCVNYNYCPIVGQ